MTPKQEQELDDLYLIAQAVKEHLNEPNCTHAIKFIVKQALESKNGLRSTTSSAGPDTTTIPEPTRSGSYE